MCLWNSLQLVLYFSRVSMNAACSAQWAVLGLANWQLTPVIRHNTLCVFVVCVLSLGVLRVVVVRQIVTIFLSALLLRLLLHATPRFEFFFLNIRFETQIYAHFHSNFCLFVWTFCPWASLDFDFGLWLFRCRIQFQFQFQLETHSHFRVVATTSGLNRLP